MSGVIEYAARLSKVIGPRPAGTEEEQQASFIIEETFKKFGLEAWVEELNCNPNYELPRVVCCVVSIVLAVLAMFLPLLVLPAMIACVVTAALFILEVVGISPLNNAAKRGISQNVIAKYVPSEGADVAASVLGADDDAIDIDGGSEEGESARSRRRSKSSGGRAKGSRKRKIVIFARYDSGRVCRELKPPFFKVLGILHWCEMGGMALIPVVLLLRILTNAEGGLLIFWNILLGVGAVLALLPVLKYIFHQTAAYSDGANNNAAGVAVMLETANRIANSANPAAIAETNRKLEETAAAISDDEGPGIVPIMHGKEAALASGMLPVDTDLIYSEAAAGRLDEASPEAEDERARKLVEEGVIAQVSIADAEAGVIGGAAGKRDLASSIPLIEVPGAEVRQAEQAPSPIVVEPPSASRELPKAPTMLDAAKAAEAAARAQAEAEYQQAIAARVQSFAPANNSQSSVPDWFKKGIEKANANKETAAEVQAQLPVQRSRFADALDAAAMASANSIAELEAREANRAQAPSYSVEDRLRQMREQILGGTAQDMAEKAEKAAVAADLLASEAASAAQAAEAAAAKNAARAISGVELTPEEAVSKASSTLQADVAAAIGARQAAEAAATAQAVGEVAEQAAVADRTISYIPVAADIPADIAVVEIGESSVADSIGKTAADILEEAQAIAGDDDSASNRKKRSIALPSLTGAMGRVSTSSQDAPLGDDAERGVGEDRTALQGRRRRVGLEGLPSTDLPPKPKKDDPAASFARSEAKKAAAKKAPAVSSRTGRASVISDASAQAEEPTTTFLAATGETDAKAALSSLDAPVAPGMSEPVVAVDTKPSMSRFETVGSDLVADMAQDDIIIEDVDDSDYTDNVTYTGAMAGPGYVEMPKSRAQRLRSIFGRKKKQDDDISFSEAVGLDEDFDARSVGAARGDWTSFRNESAAYDASKQPIVLDGGSDSDPDQDTVHTHIDTYIANSHSLRFKNRDSLSGAFDEDDEWNGGAFSTLREKISGGEGPDEGRGGSGDGRKQRSARGGSGTGSRGGSSRGGSSKGRASKGAEGRQRRRSADEVSASFVEEHSDTRMLDAEDMINERERIRSFRTGSAPLTSFEEVAAYAGAFTVDLASGMPGTGGAPDGGDVESQDPALGFQTEVWFVALGAELADNAGVKAFFSEHSEDMRGAVVIDLDAVGAGTLSLIDEEGILKRVKSSSRMKRFVTKAGAALGLHVNSVKMDWSESAAYFAAKRGLQTIHVAGIKDGKPAYQGEEDRFDDLSEEKLLENTAFVLELLNTI